MHLFRSKDTRSRRPVGLSLLLLLLLNTGLAGAAPVTVDANGRYLSYNGAAVPLIGMSGEFLSLRVMRCPSGVGPCTSDLACPTTVAPLPPLSEEDVTAKESACS